MKVSPDDFFGASPPPRIIGTECEYNAQTPGRRTPEALISADVLSSLGMNAAGAFLGTAGACGRLYMDMRMIEFASGEMMGPASAAMADMRGIDLVRTVVEKSGNDCTGVYRMSGASILGEQGLESETTGYHENYLVHRKIIALPILADFLPSILATRIYAMNGNLSMNGFNFSQKISGIGGDPISHSYGRLTNNGKKPMVFIPPTDNTNINRPDWMRMEVRYADCGVSPLARFAGIAAVSLALRLIEQGEVIGEQELKNISFKNPVMAAKVFAADVTLSQRQETIGGFSLSALDFQDKFLDAAERLSCRVDLPEDEVFGIAVIRSMVQTLKGMKSAADIDLGMEAGFDWAARHMYISRSVDAPNMHAANPEATQRSLVWDGILPSGGERFWKNFAPRNPAYTKLRALDAQFGFAERALRRGAFVDQMAAQGVFKVINWSEVSDNKGNWHSFGDVYGE